MLLLSTITKRQGSRGVTNSLCRYTRHLSTRKVQNTSQEEQIIVKNSQRKYKVDIDLVRKYIAETLKALDVPDFRVFLLICSDAKMREINKNLRQKSKSTDILSYSLPEGVCDPVSGVKDSHSYLGTLVICPAFVERQMLADKEAHEHDDLDLSEDRGVSKAMATVFSVEGRFPYLIAHGMIHLMGFDHENDADWLKMTQKEDEIMEALSLDFD